MLIHTGMRRRFDATLAGVRAVMDPARLRWIGFSHFEPDECGAHGSSYRDDGGRLLRELARVLRETIGPDAG
jgi:hypothetical protein